MNARHIDDRSDEGYTPTTTHAEFGEGNPWQYAMGQAVTPVLEAMGVHVLRAEKADEVEEVLRAAMTMTWQSGMRVAVLLTQRLLGAKAFAPSM